MSEPLINAKSHRTALVLIALSIALLSAYLHSGGLHDVIAWDEANYAFAAQQGIIANAFQMGEVNELRHDHAPMMAYAVAVSTSIFGQDEWVLRLPVVVFSALSCALLVFAAHDLSRERSPGLRLLAGAFAGLLLATSPASIELAGVLQPHTFVVFFLVLNMWTLARYLRDLHRRDALLFGASLAGQFISMEYGPVVLFMALAAVVLVDPRLLFGANANWPRSVREAVRMMIRLPLSMHRDIKLAAAVTLIVTALTWPAGVFLLGIPLNFVYYVLYAAQGHPILFRGEMHAQVPKYAYAYWYWLDYPLLLIGMLLMLLAIAIWAWRDRSAVARMMFVFAFGLTAVVHASHIMQLCKSIFMVPALALAGGLAAVWCVERLASQRLLRVAIAPVLLALCVTIAGGRSITRARDNDPNEKLIEMCRMIAHEAKPEERILAQGWPMVRYLLHLKFNRPDLQVERYDPRNFESDHLGQRLNQNDFAWAVTIGPTTAAYRDCRVLAVLHESWHIACDQGDADREYRVYRFPDSVHLSDRRLPSLSNATGQISLEEVKR